MATLVNTLYPPTINTFQKAFVNTTDAVVYFTLSSFNSASEIKHVHVTCVNQLNNENALSSYSGVLIQELKFDADSGMYYITIPPSSMVNNKFNTNQFYKVQIRFDAYDGADVPVNDEKKKNEYLLSYQQYFSEWSSVCLIRPIQEPQIHLNIFDNTTGDKAVSLQAGLVNLTGGITFEDNTEVETMQSYKIEIISEENVLLSSPTLYTADSLNPNSFNYNFDLSSLKNEDVNNLILRLTIKTKNQYQTSKDYKFVLNGDLPDDGGWNPTITAELDDETASVTVTVSNTKAFNESQILYISRASSEDSFKKWEHLYVGYVQDITGNKAKVIVDNTINSLVWYKYRVQLQNAGGLFYPRKVHDVTSVVLPQFYDAFLTRGDKQYCIRYNYKVSSFKPTVNRAKIDTLGSKYPRFAENAVLNYKQFSITGTIAAESDVYQEFLKKSAIYTDLNSLSTFYTAYKKQNDINDIVRNDVKNYTKETNSSQTYPKIDMPSEASQSFVTTTRHDWMWEREFREQLLMWLNDGEPKLYRSMAEGAMVVMLSDISLTPNDTLARFVWDFSATVYEIASASSLGDLITLGVYNGHRLDSIAGSGKIDDDEKKDYLEVIAPGQIYQWTVTEKNDIRNTVKSSLEKKYSGILSGKKPFDIVLKDIKIYFHNEPNLYYFEQGNNGSPQLIQPPVGSTADDFYHQLVKNNRIVKGYAFSFIADGSPDVVSMFVNEKGYYQFPSKVNVKSLSFDNIGDVVTVEYTVCYKTENSSSTIITGSTIDSNVIGQIQDSFEPYEYLGSIIKSKYSYISYSSNVKNYQKSMRYWKGICIDATPYAMVNIKYHDEDNYNTYEIGSTGVLHFLKNYSVDDMCFIGRRMVESNKPSRFLRDWEYRVDSSALGNDVESKNMTWFSITNIDTKDPVTIYQDSKSGIDAIGSQWIATSSLSEENGSKSYSKIDDIKNPQYNTVYGINGKLKIYYIDGQWYDFEYLLKDDIDKNNAVSRIGLASVPIEGIVSYSGQVLVTNY